MTTAENGFRALEYLGQKHNATDVSKVTTLIMLILWCRFNIWWNFLCQDLKFNLIITDYCMPEMTGYELLKKIKVFSVSIEENIWISRYNSGISGMVWRFSDGLVFFPGIIGFEGHTCGCYVFREHPNSNWQVKSRELRLLLWFFFPQILRFSVVLTGG